MLNYPKVVRKGLSRQAKNTSKLTANHSSFSSDLFTYATLITRLAAVFAILTVFAGIAIGTAGTGGFGFRFGTAGFGYFSGIQFGLAGQQTKAA